MPGQSLPPPPPQNLMPGQKLTPEIPNAQARIFVLTFIRESPPPSFVSQLYMFHQRNTQFWTYNFALT